MIANLRAYPAYKDSGVEWLGEVPEMWQVRRMKTLFQERIERGWSEEPMLAATQTHGVVRKDDYNQRTVVATGDLSLLKFVRTQDFVVSLRSFQGGIEYAHRQGIISPAYTILFAQEQDSHQYFARLFKSRSFIDGLKLFVTGIRQGQNIDYDRLSRAVLPLPPMADQSAITRFLDHVDSRIQRFITAKERLIELLEEEKQAIINRAVTHGLDPDVPLKPSGIDWLGDVPAHWKACRMANVVELRVSNVDKHVLPDEIPVRLCNYVDVYRHSRITSALEFMPGSASCREAEHFGLRHEDVVLTKDSESWEDIASPAIVIDPPSDLVCGYHLAILRPLPSVLAGCYLVSALQAGPVATQLRVAANGVTRYGLTRGAIRNVWIPLPDLAEQVAIAGFVDQAKASINQTRVTAERQICLLREYRTRLISDVVTGKLDVREAAKRLPDDPEAGDPMLDEQLEEAAA